MQSSSVSFVSLIPQLFLLLQGLFYLAALIIPIVFLKLYYERTKVLKTQSENIIQQLKNLDIKKEQLD